MNDNRSSNACQRRASTEDVWRGESVQPAYHAALPAVASEVHDPACRADAQDLMTLRQA